jgi:hypothetical protein
MRYVARRSPSPRSAPDNNPRLELCPQRLFHVEKPKRCLPQLSFLVTQTARLPHLQIRFQCYERLLLIAPRYLGQVGPDLPGSTSMRSVDISNGAAAAGHRFPEVPSINGLDPTCHAAILFRYPCIWCLRPRPSTCQPDARTRAGRCKLHARTFAATESTILYQALVMLRKQVRRHGATCNNLQNTRTAGSRLCVRCGA